MPDTRSTPPTSGAAPEERDGELDDLLREYRDLVAEQEARVADHTEALKASLADIHAHVEQVKREARAEGERAATGEVVGTGVSVGGVFQTPADGPSSVTVYLDPPIRVIGPETRVSLVLRRDTEPK